MQPTAEASSGRDSLVPPKEDGARTYSHHDSPSPDKIGNPCGEPAFHPLQPPSRAHVDNVKQAALVAPRQPAEAAAHDLQPQKAATAQTVVRVHTLGTEASRHAWLKGHQNRRQSRRLSPGREGGYGENPAATMAASVGCTAVPPAEAKPRDMRWRRIRVKRQDSEMSRPAAKVRRTRSACTAHPILQECAGRVFSCLYGCGFFAGAESPSHW
jgi:hypothetical protein